MIRELITREIRLGLFHVVADGSRRGFGINLVVGSISYAIEVVIPIFPWLSVFHSFNDNNFYFGWRIYAVAVRVSVHKILPRPKIGEWFMNARRGFINIGKPSLLMSWEEAEDLRSQYPNGINMDRYYTGSNLSCAE